MKNNISTLLLSLLLPLHLVAQQLPIFTQYRQYQAYLNPASVNTDYFTDEYNLAYGVSLRSQWVSEKGTPKTGLLFGEYVHENSDGISLVSGVNVVYDQTDPFSLTGIYGRIGGMLPISRGDGYLSAGLTLGGVQYRFNATELRNYTATGEVILDPLLQQNYSKWFPDVGLGVYYYQELERGFFDGDVVFAGISVPQVLGLDYRYDYDNGEFGIRRVAHYYGQAGLYKYLSNSSFLEFSTWIKYLRERNSLHADFNFRGQFQDIFWGGFGISTTGNLHLEAGFLLGENLDLDSGIKIGYGYDYPFTTFGSRFGPSHEINIAFMLITTER